MPDQLTPEDIAAIEARLQTLKKQKEAKLMQGSVLTEEPPPEGINSAYGPVDLALDVASLGGTTAGRMGAGALARTITENKTAQVAAQAAGALAGTAAFEKTLGRLRSEPTSNLGIGIETVANSLVPFGGRAAREAILPGDTAAKEFMQTEGAQRAFGISERTNQMMRQNTRLDPNNRMALEAIQANADRGLTGVTGSQLGAFARDSSSVRGASINFQENAPLVINDLIFDKAKSISELASLASQKAQEVGARRTELVKALDDSGARVTTGQIYEKLQPIRDLAARYKQAPETEAFGNALTTKLSEFQNYLANKAELTEAGESLIKASDLLTLSELNNEYRRVALGEFEKSAISAGARGDHPLTMEEQVAVDAFSKLGSIVNGTIDSLHNTVNNLPADSQVFSGLQKQYGGFKSVQDLARFQAENTQQGLAEKSLTNVTQTLGRSPPENAFSPTAGPKENLLTMAAEKYNALQGKPTNAAKAYSAAVNRDEYLMKNIQDYRYLNQNPMSIPESNSMPIRGALVEGAANALGAAAYGAASRATGLNQAQPQDLGKSLNDLILQQANAEPKLSRNWENIKNDASQMNLLQLQAQMQGLADSGQLATMSEPQLREMHKLIVSSIPQIAQPAPRGLNLVDNEFQNPMEKSAIMREGVNKDPVTRSKIMMSAWQNKYFETPESNTIIKQPQSQPPVELDSLTSLIPDIEPQIVSPSPMDSMSNIEKLKAKTMLHAEDWIQ